MERNKKYSLEKTNSETEKLKWVLIGFILLVVCYCIYQNLKMYKKGYFEYEEKKKRAMRKKNYERWDAGDIG